MMICFFVFELYYIYLRLVIGYMNIFIGNLVMKMIFLMFFKEYLVNFLSLSFLYIIFGVF